jgi:hypothetical protein
MKTFARAVLLGTFAALAGCGSEPTVEITPNTIRGEEDMPLRNLRERIAEHPNDLPARFELAATLERMHLLDGASYHYGIVAQNLPRRKFTRPWLCFGRCEVALGHDISGRRALEEVLATVPEDRATYVENGDYQEAALLLAGILRSQHAAVALAALETRYVSEFGGDPGTWSDGAVRAAH